MIKQLQMGFKLLKYAYGIKSCIAWGTLMLVFGILIEWGAISGTASHNMGAFFIVITAMWPIQLLISLNVPNLVAASPIKKKLQTSIFSIITEVCFLVFYLLVIAVKVMKYANGKISGEEVAIDAIMVAFLCMIAVIFLAFSTKYFVASTAVFAVTISIFMAACNFIYFTERYKEWNLSIGAGIGIGIAIIVLTSVVQYAVAVLLYKKPISKYSQLNSLRKKM